MKTITNFKYLYADYWYIGTELSESLSKLAWNLNHAFDIGTFGLTRSSESKRRQDFFQKNGQFI